MDVGVASGLGDWNLRSAPSSMGGCRPECRPKSDFSGKAIAAGNGRFKPCLGKEDVGWVGLWKLEGVRLVSGLRAMKLS